VHELWSRAEYDISTTIQHYDLTTPMTGRNDGPWGSHAIAVMAGSTTSKRIFVI